MAQWPGGRGGSALGRMFEPRRRFLPRGGQAAEAEGAPRPFLWPLLSRLGPAWAGSARAASPSLPPVPGGFLPWLFAPLPAGGAREPQAGQEGRAARLLPGLKPAPKPWQRPTRLGWPRGGSEDKEGCGSRRQLQAPRCLPEAGGPQGSARSSRRRLRRGRASFPDFPQPSAARQPRSRTDPPQRPHVPGLPASPSGVHSPSQTRRRPKPAPPLPSSAETAGAGSPVVPRGVGGRSPSAAAVSKAAAAAGMTSGLCGWRV